VDRCVKPMVVIIVRKSNNIQCYNSQVGFLEVKQIVFDHCGDTNYYYKKFDYYTRRRVSSCRTALHARFGPKSSEHAYGQLYEYD
jgi:hypothetical protein